MTRPPTPLVAGLLTLALTGVSSGQSPTRPPARDTLALATAKRLLVAMHAQEVLLEGLDSTFATMRKSGKSEMPPVFFDSLTGRIRRVVPQLIDSLATVYARQLSVADLKDLVQFYESPLGQRYSKAQVAFQLQSSEMAKRWGMRLALDVMKDLIDKGLISDLGNR